MKISAAAVGLAAACLLVLGGGARLLRGPATEPGQAAAHRSVVPAPTGVAQERGGEGSDGRTSSRSVDTGASDGPTGDPRTQLGLPAALPPPDGQAAPLVDGSTPASSAKPDPNPPTQARQSTALNPPKTTPLATDVSAEIALVAQIRGQSDLAARLALIQAYRKQFPAGALMQEVAILEVQTRCALGQHAQGQALARAFLAAHPHSAYSRIARRGCEDARP